MFQFVKVREINLVLFETKISYKEIQLINHQFELNMKEER